MTREEEARLNALQEALETEEHRIATELFHVRRTLQHLQVCRRQLATGKTPDKAKGL